MNKKHYDDGGVIGDGWDESMASPASGSGSAGTSGSAGGMGGGMAQRLLSGLKGNAKYFAAGALLGGTQGIKGALMAPVMAAMMQKQGQAGGVSKGAPIRGLPPGLSAIASADPLTLAKQAGPPMVGAAPPQGTPGDGMRRGGPVRRAMGGPVMPVAPAPAAGMAMPPQAPVAAMKKGGSFAPKKAIGGGLSGLGGIKDKFMSMQDKNKIPLKKHNYPAIRKPEIGRSIKPDMEFKKGGTMNKSEFKKAIKKAEGGCVETERRAMGGPIRQKHEMAMGKAIPTKQEPPSGTQRRAAGGSVTPSNTITSGKVKGWGSSRNTGGGKVC